MIPLLILLHFHLRALSAVLLHSGMVHGSDVGPTDIAGVIAYLKVIPGAQRLWIGRIYRSLFSHPLPRSKGLASYPSAWDYGNRKLMKSRKFAQPYPVTLQVERVELLERDHLLRSTYYLPQRCANYIVSRGAATVTHCSTFAFA